MTASYFSQTGLAPSDTKSDEYMQPPPQIRENLQSLQSGILKIFFVLCNISFRTKKQKLRVKLPDSMLFYAY